MGMAKSLKNEKELNLLNFSYALKSGYENVITKTGSKEGEKTMLDSLVPATKTLLMSSDSGIITKQALSLSAQSALDGAYNTKNMIALHGRAAYHNQKTLGHIDGGAMAIAYIFEAIAKIGA